MSGDDHYALLGVRSDASAREIRRAYRRLARQHHPDVNPRSDGPERFAQLAHAYAILNDPDQRARYDETLLPRVVPRPPRPRIAGRERTVQRGILELSPSEAQHVVYQPLTLTDGIGRTIVLPAGAGHGDEITLLYDGRPVTLTIQLQRKT
ncbi:MAG TPA: J domain-containing protein [Solirubrobacteraceae bacterium]|nr:J domain-containing protein [Solirubrobacteraceae bacterium]